MYAYNFRDLLNFLLNLVAKLGRVVMCYENSDCFRCGYFLQRIVKSFKLQNIYNYILARTNKR